MLSWEYIQFLNEKIMEYLPPDRVRVGNKINFRCPLCGDSHKSLTKKRGFYYLDNASYYCFNCGTGLSGIKFLQILSGKDYDDIKVEYLKLFAKSGLDSSLSSYFEKPDDEPSLFDLKRAVKPEWKKPLTEDARKYIDGRLVSKAPFLKEDLYSCDIKGNDYILIPWIANGVEAYYQLNDYQKHGPIKYIFPKNRKKLVYGLDNIDISWPYIIVFEGVYDSLFVKNSVAVGTKSITDYQRRLIRERYPNHRLCVSFDNDSAGIDSMCRMIRKNEDVSYFRWFNKNTQQKDVNDYVKARGDVNAFSDPKKLDKMISSPLQMKMWLAQNGMWIDPRKNRQAKPDEKSELKALAARLTA